MSLFPEIFRSMELVWTVWGISCIASLIFVAGLRRGKPLTKELWRNEDGAAYSLTYVMTFPLYALFVALIIECSLLLVTKIGSMYAAYAAVRAAVVWESAKSGSGGVLGQRMQEKARRAAVLGMVPFASGSSQHSAGSSAGSDLVPPVAASADLFRAGRFVNQNYLARKVRYAASHTALSSISRESDAPDALLTVTLQFNAPLHIPGIGRLIGQKSGNGYWVIPVVTQASLPAESPQNEARDIGIQYSSE